MAHKGNTLHRNTLQNVYKIHNIKMDKEMLQHISGLIVCMASQVDVCYTSF